MSDLPKRLQDALVEIDRHQSSGGWRRIRPYWWRRKSMEKLSELGLVHRDPAFGTEAQPAWRISEKGREVSRGLRP